MRFLPPVVTGPIIVLHRPDPGPLRREQRLHLLAFGPDRPWPSSSSANIWGKGMIKIIPILLGVVVSYIVAVIMPTPAAPLR